ncbi:DUF4179 domain-containing protein [Neobacillus sp. DY30]|uniref:anti-sigma factor family protein n=1 Tax=Neobacillus sp. DY30 TaxID=3047871 RepID=UPI0024BF93E8|nr:DUF4179 domain-containing protein [Neobacillus sp. DY30]WHY01371.1 DUF4179 domain-containing protein [Neobacillus sp. DY30]
MNCPTIDRLSQYVDNLLTEQELVDISAHLESCNDCKHMVEELYEEQKFLIETLQTPALPDDFAFNILTKLDPYEKQTKKPAWKRRMLFAAGVVLAVGLSTTLHPSFARWVGGLFATEQVDEGLRIASNAGMAERVNSEVTDQGLTLRVEDLVADSSRVALSYQIVNKKGKVRDSYIELADSKNEIYASDQNGKRLEGVGFGWQDGSDYGLIEFSLREQEDLEVVKITFDLAELDGVKGNWKLEIPVDLKERNKFTTKLSLNGKVTIMNGVNINMKEVRFAPSSSELLYETSYSKEEQAKLEEKIRDLKERVGEEIVNSFTNYGTAIQYHIENEENKAVYHHNSFLEGKGHPSDSGVLQGSGADMEKIGQVAWNESFIPQKEDGKLTFVLDGVVKTVPSDFSIKIKPKELKNHPVSFEYEGNYLTIKEAEKNLKFSLRKSLKPIEIENIFTIKMEGGKEAGSSDLGSWALVDNKGKAFLTYHSGSILDEKDENDHYKTNFNIKSYDIDEVPEELTLHLLSVTRYEKAGSKWEVPLYK